jgi:hypothetical protein
MTNKVSPCPDCGGECREDEHPETVEHVGSGEVYCLLCRYNVVANTKAQTIAHHERLAGRCRWENNGWGPDYYECECDKETRTDKEIYCPNCGKEVEEVG